MSTLSTILLGVSRLTLIVFPVLLAFAFALGVSGCQASSHRLDGNSDAPLATDPPEALDERILAEFIDQVSQPTDAGFGQLFRDVWSGDFSLVAWVVGADGTVSHYSWLRNELDSSATAPELRYQSREPALANAVFALRDHIRVVGRIASAQPTRPISGLSRDLRLVLRSFDGYTLHPGRLPDGAPAGLIRASAQSDKELAQELADPSNRSWLLQDARRLLDHPPTVLDALRDQLREVETAVIILQASEQPAHWLWTAP